MTCLIFGACGFCGVHLARKLSELKGARVVGADVLPEPPAGLPLDLYERVDISDAEEVAGLIRKVSPEWVFNLAALTAGQPQAIYSVNVMGVVNLLEALRMHAPESRTVQVGSAAEYGRVAESDNPVTEDHPCRPIGHYGVSKYAATQAALTYQARDSLKVVVVRPFNIIGAGIPESLVVGAVIARARQALASGMDVVRVGNLDTQRDFISVQDAVNAYTQAIQSDNWGKVFNICSGRPLTIREVVELALSHAPRPISLEVDASLVRADDVRCVYGSWERAHDAFGFRPTAGIGEAVADAWERACGTTAGR